MKKLLIPTFIILLFAAFKSNTFVVKTINGIVKDKDSGRPIAGALVSTINGKTQTNTGKDGSYSIHIGDTEKGLKFTALGYEPATIMLNGNTKINVSMAESKSSLSEVVELRSDKKVKIYAPSRETHSSMRVGAIASKADRGSVERSVRSTETPLGKRIPGDGSATNVKPQSNQLTAGEWNDLDNWDFWNNLMNNQEWSNKQAHWEFYTNNRIRLTLKNKQQQPLINYAVSVLNNNVPVWKAQTNFEGKVELWPSLYSNKQQKFTIVINTADGKEVYRNDFEQNARKVNITLNRTFESIKNLDVLFMVDATGSMGDEIDYLKSELEDIIGSLKNKGRQLNTRTALVFYRDKGDDYVVRDFGFDQNLQNVKKNLSQQSAGGGGDFEEAVEEAMENAIYQQRWSTEGVTAKIMFMILDAPPHHDPARVKSIQRSVKEAAAKGIALIPVVASGIDKNTEFLMRFMALSTNGTYVFLTDDSGIGNTHLKPTVGSYQVENLNKLLNRLINKYAGLEANVAEDSLSSTKK